MRVKDIYEWAKENEICDLVCMIEDAIRNGVLSFYDDEYKLWCLGIKKPCKYELARSYSGVVLHEEKISGDCVKVKGTNLVYSPGIVGALSREQREKYCENIEEIDRPKAEARIKRWKRFVNKCKRETAGMTGVERLREYIECMRGVKRTRRR